MSVLVVKKIFTFHFTLVYFLMATVHLRVTPEEALCSGSESLMCLRMHAAHAPSIRPAPVWTTRLRLTSGGASPPHPSNVHHSDINTLPTRSSQLKPVMFRDVKESSLS